MGRCVMLADARRRVNGGLHGQGAQGIGAKLVG